MSAMLLSLRISQEAEIRHRTDNAVTGTQRLSEAGLQADILLTPDADTELGQQLGIVRIQIEATPRLLPDMTPQQTLDWLRAALTRMLA